MRLLYVVGARPNFMKVAPLMRETARRGSRFEQVLVHTGQHYDFNMSEVFFKQLGMPAPDHFLAVSGGNHTEQTAHTMLKLHGVNDEVSPDLVVVVGDTNSTLAAALVAAKYPVPVAHVEAGLRSRDREMPEETNRIIVDHISDYLFTPSRDGNENLASEGIPSEKVFFVGNVMIDSLVTCLDMVPPIPAIPGAELQAHEYAVLTLHRPSNVDEPGQLRSILGAIAKIAERSKVVFPLHPRTRARIEAAGMGDLLKPLTVVEPLGYLDFLSLTRSANLVLTDSGGLQEETTYLGVPCLTLRENTERPVTVTDGTNSVIGTNPDRIVAEAMDALENRHREPRKVPALWDGHTSERILDVLESHAAR